MTDKPYMQPNYRDNRAEMKAIRKWAKEGKMNKDQAWFYGSFRPAEELYDLEKDPHELRSVANEPAYKDELIKFRKILEDWIKETDDKGQYPEISTVAGIEGLRFILDRWGDDRCNDPIFDVVREHKIDGKPAKDVKLKNTEI